MDLDRSRLLRHVAWGEKPAPCSLQPAACMQPGGWITRVPARSPVLAVPLPRQPNAHVISVPLGLDRSMHHVPSALSQSLGTLSSFTFMPSSVPWLSIDVRQLQVPAGSPKPTIMIATIRSSTVDKLGWYRRKQLYKIIYIASVICWFVFPYYKCQLCKTRRARSLGVIRVKLHAKKGHPSKLPCTQTSNTTSSLVRLVTSEVSGRTGL